MVAPAIFAFAPRTTDRGARRLAAVGAERIMLVPVEQALGLAQSADDIGRHEPLVGDRAQVDERQRAALLGIIVARRLDQLGEERAVSMTAEEHGVGRAAERLRLGEGEQRVVAGLFGLEGGDLAREHEVARPGMIAQAGDESFVLPLVGHAVQRVEREAGGVRSIEQVDLRAVDPRGRGGGDVVARRPCVHVIAATAMRRRNKTGFYRPLAGRPKSMPRA